MDTNTLFGVGTGKGPKISKQSLRDVLRELIGKSNAMWHQECANDGMECPGAQYWQAQVVAYETVYAIFFGLSTDEEDANEKEGETVFKPFSWHDEAIEKQAQLKEEGYGNEE